MAGYSRMVIMSMSEEEIKRVLTEERDSISDYAAFMMVEELKRRKEQAEREDDLSAEELCAEELDEEYNDDTEGGEPEEGQLPEDYEFIEDIEEIEELTEEDLDENLSDEERAERKRQRQIEELEKIKEDRKKTLILACVGTVVAALAIVGFMIYLAASGQL